MENETIGALKTETRRDTLRPVSGVSNSPHDKMSTQQEINKMKNKTKKLGCIIHSHRWPTESSWRGDDVTRRSTGARFFSLEEDDRYNMAVTPV